MSSAKNLKPDEVAKADEKLPTVEHGSPYIETPIEETPPVIENPPSYVAGIKAVISATTHALAQMGPIRSTKALLALNQKNGIDCPSCAWPDPDDRRKLAEFCENGTKAVSDEATGKKVSPEFFAKHSVEELSKQSDYELNKNGRITHPMILNPGDKFYSPISWEEAFEMIAKHLNALENPDEAAFYTSGRTSNEAAFLYQIMVRLFGTSNLPDCSNLCHESSTVGLTEQIGIGKGTVKLDDFNKAECILVIGQNPATNHPRMLAAFQSAVRNGCKIISINPLKETGMTTFRNPQEINGWFGKGTKIATLFLQVRLNGDVALLKGIMKFMFEHEDANPGTVLDKEFIARYTHGFDEFSKDIRAADWNEILEESGVPLNQIQEAAQILINSKATIACWAMGITHHKNAVANVQTIANLIFMQGNIGKPGAGVCPVRGHSNVQGDRTVGINSLAPEHVLKSIEDEFHFIPSRKKGYGTVEALEAMHAGKIKVMVSMGGNLISAVPDVEYVSQGTKKCELTVQISTKLNRAHLVTGKTALILPCLGRTEVDRQQGGIQFMTCEDSMGIVHSSRGTLSPASPHLLSEIAIVTKMAQALFKDKPEKLNLVDWQGMEANYDLIRDRISKTFKGFDNYNERVRQPGGFYLPNAPRDSRTFNNDLKLAKFIPHPIAKTHIPQGQYTLMTMRSHDQFNTTIYGLNDRYRGISQGRRVIFINHEDMKELGLSNDDIVDLSSEYSGVVRSAPHFIVVPYDIPRQCVATYFPEGNVLVPIECRADRSNTPVFKSIIIRIEKSKSEGDVKRLA